MKHRTSTSSDVMKVQAKGIFLRIMQDGISIERSFISPSKDITQSSLRDWNDFIAESLSNRKINYY